MLREIVTRWRMISMKFSADVYQGLRYKKQNACCEALHLTREQASAHQVQFLCSWSFEQSDVRISWFRFLLLIPKSSECIWSARQLKLQKTVCACVHVSSRHPVFKATRSFFTRAIFCLHEHKKKPCSDWSLHVQTLAWSIAIAAPKCSVCPHTRQQLLPTKQLTNDNRLPLDSHRRSAFLPLITDNPTQVRPGTEISFRLTERNLIFAKLQKGEWTKSEQVP